MSASFCIGESPLTSRRFSERWRQSSGDCPTKSLKGSFGMDSKWQTIHCTLTPTSLTTLDIAIRLGVSGMDRKTVDSMWDFDFRDELRRLAGNRIYTSLGQVSRSERVRAMITGNRCWDDMGKRWRQRWVGDLHDIDHSPKAEVTRRASTFHPLALCHFSGCPLGLTVFGEQCSTPKSSSEH